MSTFDVSNEQLAHFQPVLEAWNTPPTHTDNGWTYVPICGHYGNGWSSHLTYAPGGDGPHHLSTYNNDKKHNQYNF